MHNSAFWAALHHATEQCTSYLQKKPSKRKAGTADHYVIYIDYKLAYTYQPCAITASISVHSPDPPAGCAAVDPQLHWLTAAPSMEARLS